MKQKLFEWDLRLCILIHVYNIYILLGRGVARGEGEKCGFPRQQSPRGGKNGGKMNILNEKNSLSPLDKF